MRTIKLEIDDDIFDKFMILLELLPNKKIRISNNDFNVPYLDNEEQKEIEELLKDPECHESSGVIETIEI